MTTTMRLVPVEREQTAIRLVPVEREQTVLLGWLQLVGWTVVIDRDGSEWIGLARRTDELGAEVCVGGSASSHRELVSKLFNRANRGLALAA